MYWLIQHVWACERVNNNKKWIETTFVILWVERNEFANDRCKTHFRYTKIKTGTHMGWIEPRPKRTYKWNAKLRNLIKNELPLVSKRLVSPIQMEVPTITHTHSPRTQICENSVSVELSKWNMVLLNCSVNGMFVHAELHKTHTIRMRMWGWKSQNV